MNPARPGKSATDRHAKRIATQVARGLPPRIDADLDQYLETCPHEVFAAFEGAARRLTAKRNDPLAVGYLFLMQGLLERLRYRTDRGDAQAVALVADFQAEVVARFKAGAVDGRVLSYVGGALHEAKIAASPDLVAASAAHIEQGAERSFPSDVQDALAAMIESSGGDPFALVESLAQLSHALPVATRAAMAQHFASSGTPSARSTAILFLLDDAPSARRAAAAALVAVAPSLRPADLRRLIALRSWRPEEERAGIDSVILAAREAGVACAAWEPGDAETIVGSSIDGSGSQGLLVVSPAGRKKRLSSILAKDGIADAWIAAPDTRRGVENTLAKAVVANLSMFRVSRAYLDRVVCHGLAICVEKGKVPPPGLLQVAEAIGGAEWQPRRMDFAGTLAGLLAELPEAMREASSVRSVLRGSGDLAGLAGISDAWFDDGPEIARLAAAAPGGGRATLAQHLLHTAFARDRARWAELFLHTALWMREATARKDLPWRDLALVAEAVAGQGDLADIGLMLDIAGRSIDALAYRRESPLPVRQNR